MGVAISVITGIFTVVKAGVEVIKAVAGAVSEVKKAKGAGKGGRHASMIKVEDVINKIKQLNNPKAKQIGSLLEAEFKKRNIHQLRSADVDKMLKQSPEVMQKTLEAQAKAQVGGKKKKAVKGARGKKPSKNKLEPRMDMQQVPAEQAPLKGRGVVEGNVGSSMNYGSKFNRDRLVTLDVIDQPRFGIVGKDIKF